MEEFKKFMRYNDYKNDNLTENKPSKTIASRGDLDEKSKSCHGAIDVKFVSIKELLEKNNIIHIISGPSNDQQPTFSWKNTTCESNMNKLSYKGQNEIWNFPWIDYNVQLFEKNDNKDNNDNGDKSYIYWIIGVSIFVVIVAVVIIIIVIKRKNKGDQDIDKLLGGTKELEEHI